MTLDEFNKKGFNPGDVLMVVHGSIHWLIIFAGLRESSYHGGAVIKHAFLFHAITDINDSNHTSVCIDEVRPGIGYVEDDAKNVRLANNAEKKILFDRIKKFHGVMWDGQSLRRIQMPI